MDQFGKFTFSQLAPVPRIFKGCRLGMRYAAIARLEETVVTSFGIEGGIKVDQVNALRLDLVSQYVEVVPEVEAVRRHRAGSFIEDGYRRASYRKRCATVTGDN